MISIELKEKRSVTITKKQFLDLKMSEVSELFNEYKIIIEPTKSGLHIWACWGAIKRFSQYPRLAGTEMVLMNNFDIGYIVITNNNPLAATLTKRFNRAFLK